MARVARGPQRLQIYLAFGRSTTPIHGKGCASRRKVKKKLQLYLAFGRATTQIHGNGCASRRNVEKMCNFTSRSRVRPRQSLGRVARDTEKLQIYLAFGRSATPIHGKGCASRRHVGKNVQLYLALARSTTPIHGNGCVRSIKIATLPRVRAFDHANPWEGLRVAPKMCNFTSRSRVRPRQSMGRVARHADMLEKMWKFSSRSRVRPPNPW